MSQCCKGSWIDCINPFHNPVMHKFFRHIPMCKIFNRNDGSTICSMCWRIAQEQNGTLTRVPLGNRQNSWIEHLTKSKPEKDTL